MPEIKDIHWSELPGNRFSKAIDSAMVSEAGYVAPQKVRKSNEPKGTLCNVTYDRNYLVETLVRKIVKPLSVLGKDEIISLVDEAWTSYCKESIVPSSTNANFN